MVFLKLLDTESQVDHKTQPFWWSTQYVMFKPQLGMLLAPSIWHQQLPSISTQYKKPSIHFRIGFFLFFVKIRSVIMSNVWFNLTCIRRQYCVEMEGSCWCQMDGANGMPSQGLNIGYQMDHLDPKRLGFVIYLGLRMNQFQKYHLLCDLLLAELCCRFLVLVNQLREISQISLISFPSSLGPNAFYPNFYTL